VFGGLCADLGEGERFRRVYMFWERAQGNRPVLCIVFETKYQIKWI